MRYPPTFGFPCSVLLLLTLALPLTAQTTFQRTYGGIESDYGYSVAQTADGGYVITGGTESFGTHYWDVYLIKTDASGDTLWTRTFGGTDRDQGFSVAQTTDGGYILAGYTESFGAGLKDIWLIRTGATGDTAWTRIFGGAENDWGYSVVQTTDGGYVIVGYTKSFGAGDYDAWLIKTDASGDTIWTRTFGGADDDWGHSVRQTADGGYIVTGWTESYGTGENDAWLIKTNNDGDTIWTRTFGGADDDWGHSVRQTADGGYIITGYTNYLSATLDDIFLIKTNASGDTLWTRTWGGGHWDVGYSVAQTADGGYVITGSLGGDVWLIKTDASGDTMWTRTFGGASYDGGYSVAQTADGGYIITGYTQSFGAGGYDVWLIKTDSAGNAAAIAELEPPVARAHIGATIVRGVLRMPETEVTNARYPMTLLDISGREVAKLQPGDNDVRHLSPGMYFVREASSVERQASSVRKVILTR